MEPTGAHSYWGFSPAVDLLQVHASALGHTCAGNVAAPSSSDSSGTKAVSSPSGASETTQRPFCALLLSPGDSRHVLKTIAQRRRHSHGGRPAPPIHLFVYERSAEVLARIMLQLAIACDWELPLRQRAVLWLELYGNALIQSRTAAYLSSKLRAVLVDVLCNERGPAPLPALFDFSLLKHRQRDELEEVLKSWAESVPFDMATLRDHRLRHHYGTRYDFRNNLIDWDYQMGVKPHVGSIHFSTFREWRNSGVAFEFGDCVYSVPNRTMASFVEGKEAGRGSVARRGYWGDILVGPYHAVGTATYVPTDVEAEAADYARQVQSAELLASVRSTVGPTAGGAGSSGAGASASGAGAGATKGKDSDSSSNSAKPGNYAWQLFDISARRHGSEQWRHHAVEIAVHNVLSWLFEIETGRPYIMRQEHDVYSGLADANLLPEPPAVATATKPDKAAAPDAPSAAATAVSTAAATGAGAGAGAAVPESAHPPELVLAAAAARARTIAQAFRGVKITFLTGDMDGDWLAKGKLAGKFDAITLSGRTVHYMDKPGFAALPAPTPCTATGTSLGCVILAETARNVLHLKKDLQTEFARRVTAMAGALGAALVTSDRALSADSYSVGTIIDVGTDKSKDKDKDKEAAAKAATVDPTGIAVFPPDATPFLPAMHGGAAAAAAATGAPSAAASSPSSGGAAPVPRRNKATPFAAMAHAPLPHPALAGLLAAESEAAEAGASAAAFADASAPALPAAAAAAATAAAHRLEHAIAAALPRHEPAGGDNPPPEALVFALLPGTGTGSPSPAAAVREAFTSRLRVKPGTHGEATRAAEAASADSAAAASNASGGSAAALGPSAAPAAPSGGAGGSA